MELNRQSAPRSFGVCAFSNIAGAFVPKGLDRHSAIIPLSGITGNTWRTELPIFQKPGNSVRQQTISK
jgi:hypothetical protein